MEKQVHGRVGTLSQMFDLCEEINGKGSTALLASYNERGNNKATLDCTDPNNVRIFVDGCLVGLSRGRS